MFLFCWAMGKILKNSALLDFRSIQIAIDGVPMSPVDHQEQEIFRSIKMIHDLFMSSTKTPDQVDEIEKLAEKTIDYISNNPLKERLQADFAKVMSYDMSGLSGISLLASTAMRLSNKSNYLLEEPSEQDKSTDDSLEAAFSWFKSYVKDMNGEYRIGYGSIPKIKMPSNIQQTINSLMSMIDHLCDQVSDDDDITAIKLALHVCALLAKETGDTNQDMHIIRVVAGKIATYHNPQIARDLAETALEWSTLNGNAMRTRMAWFAFSDIYLRCHDRGTSWFGLACAFSQKTDSLCLKQHLEETYLLCRLLRETGLLKDGQEILKEIVGEISHMEIYKEFKHRMQHLDISFRLVALLRKSDIYQWKELLEELALACQNLSQFPDELYPYVVSLGQTIIHAKKAKIDTSVYEEILKKSNILFKGGMQGTIKIMNADKPSLEDIKQLIKRLGSTRYAEDMAHDIDLLNTVSRRFLSQGTDSYTPLEAALVSELLTDLTLQPHQWHDPKETVVQQLLNEIEISRILKDLNHNGYTVHYLGVDNDGYLHRTTSNTAFQLESVVIPKEIFSLQKYSEWKIEYPYMYGNKTQVGGGSWNHLYTSMQQLQLDCAPDSKMIFIKDILIQQIPSNIIFMQNKLSCEKSEVSSVPSLNWLSSIRNSSHSFDSNWLAWIPVDLEDQKYNTLNILYQRLIPIMAEFNIQISTLTIPNRNFFNGELVIIGAHGGLSPSDDFFHSIADENGNNFNALYLRHIIKAKIVVLFICNAGREGSSPFSHAASSIAHRLLDKGSHTVIASPWPLDSTVPVHWLPIFLECLKKHEPVGHAVMTANLAVRTAMSWDPSEWLAMSVFGDPSVSL